MKWQVLKHSVPTNQDLALSNYILYTVGVQTMIDIKLLFMIRLHLPSINGLQYYDLMCLGTY